MACEVIVVQKSPFIEKLGFWRNMAKIWHKVQENGTKKIRLAKLVAKEKKYLAQTLFWYKRRGFAVININIISYLVVKNVILRFRPCLVYPVG